MKSTSKFLFTLPISLLALGANAALFQQGFETDITGWETPTRVASGSGGIASASGGFHATAAGDPFGGAGLTRWGGYNYGAGPAIPTVFQEYTTSVAIYLNIGGAWANNTRFDFDSAINNSLGNFKRDFIFNGGFYNAADVTGPGAGTDRFVFSASNNSQPGSAFPKNPARAPIAITTTGWYTFEHHFYDNAGVLAVDLSILDSSSSLISSWTLSDPTDLIAGVGGNRYGWFDFNQFSTLAFDDSSLTLAAVPEPTTLVAGALLLLPFGAGAFRKLRKNRTA